MFNVDISRLHATILFINRPDKRKSATYFRLLVVVLLSVIHFFFFFQNLFHFIFFSGFYSQGDGPPSTNQHVVDRVKQQTKKRF